MYCSKIHHNIFLCVIPYTQSASPMLEAIIAWLKKVQTETKGKKSVSSSANLKLGVMWEELKRQYPEIQSSSVMAILEGELISSSYENLDMHLAEWDAATREKMKQYINNAAIISSTDDNFITIVAELAAETFLRAHTERPMAVIGDPTQGYSTLETKHEDCPDRGTLPDGKTSSFTPHDLLSLVHTDELGIDSAELEDVQQFIETGIEEHMSYVRIQI